MIICKINLQLMVTAFKENLGFTVLLCLYLKQYLFQNKLQRTGLEGCQRLVTN